VALALRLSGRQRAQPVRHRQHGLAAGRPRGPSAAVIPLARVRAAAAAAGAAGVPAASGGAAPESAPVPLDPEQAHRAKLAALQALLALGDAKAEQAARSGGAQFADTEAVGDDDYAATQLFDRSEAPSGQASLLNLDKDPRKARRAQR
jgi:hypothetical protein